MILTTPITMDLLRAGVLPTIEAVQGDTNSRAVQIQLLADGTPWPVPQDVRVRVNYILPDGSGSLYFQMEDGSPGCTVLENRLTIFLRPELLEQAGTVMLSVSLQTGVYILSTFSVMVEVLPGIPETLVGKV